LAVMELIKSAGNPDHRFDIDTIFVD